MTDELVDYRNRNRPLRLQPPSSPGATEERRNKLTNICPAGAKFRLVALRLPSRLLSLVPSSRSRAWDTEVLANYRPVPNLTFLSEVLEMVNACQPRPGTVGMRTACLRNSAGQQLSTRWTTPSSWSASKTLLGFQAVNPAVLPVLPLGQG